MGGNFRMASAVVGQRVDGNYDDPRGSTVHHPPQGNKRTRRRRGGGEFGGGSCKDLFLPIDFPDGGSGWKQDCGGTPGKAWSGAGGSCDDLLVLSSIGCLSNASSGVDVGRDYDTPASLASGNSSRWKLHCEYSVSKKTEAVTEKEKSIDFGERSKCSGVHEVKDETSVRLKTTMDAFLERDSFLTDYDVPKSARQPSGDKIMIRNDSAGISPAPKGSKVKDFANRDARKLSPKAVSSNPCIAGDQDFTNDLNKVRDAIDDVISHSNRWTMSANRETVQLIVRQACLSVWAKLQALLISFSKLLVKTRHPAAAALKDHFGSLKVSAGRIEEILTGIARCRPNEASLDFAKELGATAEDIRTHIDRCVEILTGSDDVHKASALHPNAPVVGDAGSSRARPPVSLANQKTAFEKPAAGDPLRLDRVKTMADVLWCKTNRVTSSKTPRPTRCPQKPSNPEAVAIRRAERRHATDDVKVSRGAVVFGEDREYFRILERRCPDSPTTPSKLVAQSSSSDRLNPSESVDYDLLRTRAEAEVSISGNAGSRGASDDRGAVVEFYRAQVVAVLKQLNATYRSVVESLGSGSDGSLAAAEFRTLIVGFRRLGFICDALERSAATSAAIRKTVRSHSSALVNETRAIVQTFMSCVGAKWQPVSRKLFLKRIEEMVRHSMAVADILY